MSRFKPTPTLVIALVALVFAMGGGAVAATQITGGQIVNGSVTGKDVKNRSLGKSDFRGSVRGPRGARGAQGPQGPAGPSVIGGLNVYQSAQVPYGPSDLVQTATAFCPSGQRVVSGGGVNIGDQEIWLSIPTPGRSGWGVGGADLTDSGGEYVQAYAVCGPAGQAVAAKAPVSRAQVRKYVAGLEAQERARR